MVIKQVGIKRKENSIHTKLHMLTVIVRSVFQKDGKYYPQVFLDECLYECFRRDWY